MASGAASTSSTQAPSDAHQVEDVQERRQAQNGKWYTKEEFRQYYQTPYRTKRLGNWWRIWDQAVREAAAHVTSRAESAAASATSTAEPAAADESGRGSRLVEAGNERGASQLAEAVLIPQAKAAPTPGQFAEWRDNPSEKKQRLMNEAKLILSTNVEDKKRIDAFLRELREGAREAVPPGAASARGASQPATDASPTGGTSLAPSGAPLVEHEQENKETEENPIIKEFLQVILPDHEQAPPVGAEATVEEVAQQAASAVGSETAAGESMAALCQGLRARNKKWLETASCHQAHLLEAWERISLRPRRSAGRDVTQRDPRVLSNWAHAGDPAVAPGTADAFQPGVEFPQATLRQEKQACSATERERVAALFIELRMQNDEVLEKAIAQRAQQTEAWQNELEERERKWNEFDQAFDEGIARLERRWGATHVTQGWLLKGSWV